MTASAFNWETGAASFVDSGAASSSISSPPSIKERSFSTSAFWLSNSEVKAVRRISRSSITSCCAKTSVSSEVASSASSSDSFFFFVFFFAVGSDFSSDPAASSALRLSNSSEAAVVNSTVSVSFMVVAWFWFGVGSEKREEVAAGLSTKSALWIEVISTVGKSYNEPSGFSAIPT